MKHDLELKSIEGATLHPRFDSLKSHFVGLRSGSKNHKFVIRIRQETRSMSLAESCQPSIASISNGIWVGSDEILSTGNEPLKPIIFFQDEML
jgi:hypothetical protein